MKRNRLVVESLPGFEPEIGRWIWCLEDIRKTILEKVCELSPDVIGKRIDDQPSIGSLLYHIALIEADWLYEEVLEGKWNSTIKALFPYEDRHPDGTLTHIEGMSLDEHVHRLRAVREDLHYHYCSMDIDEWRRVRSLASYDVTPEWVIYHLLEHESHHRGQIFQMIRALKSR
ncbi:DinB family protein [Ornithinibacillus xuwenensis]|uniref:DinB family protein n=1 Tax=Ornithinibacillus xuwenensis TaxID=3144668 RepID=A0ABU9XJL6_9BACI